MTTAIQTESKKMMNKGHRMNLDIHKYVAKVIQAFGTLFFRIIFYALFDIEIKGSEHISKKQGPVIIASNHVVFYDSFLFHLFFTPTSSLLPLRFMGTKKFDNPLLNFFHTVGIIPLVYLIFGVFTVTQGDGLEKNLKNAFEILERKGTVTIFPAGGMRPDNSLGEFKRGAAALAQTSHTPIIPIYLKREKKAWKRTSITIHVGPQFSLNPSRTFIENTEVIHKKIKTLCDTI